MLGGGVGGGAQQVAGAAVEVGDEGAVGDERPGDVRAEVGGGEELGEPLVGGVAGGVEDGLENLRRDLGAVHRSGEGSDGVVE